MNLNYYYLLLLFKIYSSNRYKNLNPLNNKYIHTHIIIII
jgi:hypothetical protein